MSFCFSNLITEFPSDGNSVYKILGRKKNYSDFNHEHCGFGCIHFDMNVQRLMKF